MTKRTFWQKVNVFFDMNVVDVLLLCNSAVMFELAGLTNLRSWTVPGVMLVILCIIRGVSRILEMSKIDALMDLLTAEVEKIKKAQVDRLAGRGTDSRKDL